MSKLRFWTKKANMDTNGYYCSHYLKDKSMMKDLGVERNNRIEEEINNEDFSLLIDDLGAYEDLMRKYKIKTTEQLEKRLKGKIDWISVKEKLPENNQRVLIWNGGVDVATFKRGISEEERELMKQGKLKDWEENGECLTIGYTMHNRSSIIKRYDEWGNNLVPYGWDVEGTVLFGQDISHWAYINHQKENSYGKNQSESNVGFTIDGKRKSGLLAVCCNG